MTGELEGAQALQARMSRRMAAAVAYWRTFDDGPSYSVVSLDWPASLSIMRSTARKAYHTPIRWEVNPRFFMLMGRPDVFHDLPVVESEGSFCRLICRERTYELDLNA